MAVNRISKNNIQFVAGGVALVALLAYTWVHTGGLLARYIAPTWVGYVAAFGIEMAVVSLSLRIGDLRRSKQKAKFFVSVLIAVVIVSAIANIAEGFATQTGEVLTWMTVRQLDLMQVVIGLTATGLVSLIVLAMSEIIGTDMEALVKQSAKDDIQLTKLRQDLSSTRKELAEVRQDYDKLVQERDNLRHKLDNDVITLDRLPEKFGAVVSAVVNGEPLNGELVSKHGIAQSTLDRVMTLIR